jgi:hypothetical protein
MRTSTHKLAFVVQLILLRNLRNWYIFIGIGNARRWFYEERRIWGWFTTSFSNCDQLISDIGLVSDDCKTHCASYN